MIQVQNITKKVALQEDHWVFVRPTGLESLCEQYGMGARSKVLQAVEDTAKQVLPGVSYLGDGIYGSTGTLDQVKSLKTIVPTLYMKDSRIPVELSVTARPMDSYDRVA